MSSRPNSGDRAGGVGGGRGSRGDERGGAGGVGGRGSEWRSGGSERGRQGVSAPQGHPQGYPQGQPRMQPQPQVRAPRQPQVQPQAAGQVRERPSVRQPEADFSSAISPSPATSSASASVPKQGQWTLTPGTGEYSAAATVQKAAAVRARRRRAWRVAASAVLALCAALLVATVGLLGYERWWAHDDAADFCGTWLIRGDAAMGHDAATITITDTKLVLDKNTTYTYTLDTSAKTINFAFAPQGLAGQGHYRFSTDRSRLIIVDGEFSWFETCASDLWWLARVRWAKLTGAKEPALGPTAGVTLLERDGAAAASAGEGERAPEPGAALVAVPNSSGGAGQTAGQTAPESTPELALSHDPTPAAAPEAEAVPETGAAAAPETKPEPAPAPAEA